VQNSHIEFNQIVQSV